MVESKLHLVTVSDADAISIAASPSAEAALPAGNLLYSDREKIARWTGAPNPITLTGSRVSSDDSPYTASGFALGRHNFKNDVKIRLRLFDDIDQGGATVYDSGALDAGEIIPWGIMQPGVNGWAETYNLGTGTPAIFSHFFSPVNWLSYQVDITNPTASVVDIGRLMLGYAFVPSANFSWGSELEWVDPSTHSRAASGGLHTDLVDSYRRYRLPLDWLTDIDRDQLSEQLEKATKSSEMLVSLNPNATGRRRLENTMICKRVSNNSYVPTHFNNNQTVLEVEES